MDKYVDYAYVVVGITVILLVLFNFALMSKGTYNLPNGYYVSKAHGDDIEIFSSRAEWQVIGRNVDKYRAVGTLVVGHVSPPQGTKEFEEVPGYFFIDTKTDKVKKGLSKSELESILKSRGVKKLPRLLSTDSRLDTDLARLHLR